MSDVIRQMSIGGVMLDVSSDAFAKRLANLLLATRQQAHRTLRGLARQSRGTFTRADLKAAETGLLPLDDVSIDALVGLYQCDLTAILPSRMSLSVEQGKIVTGGVERPFEPSNSTALLEAYLRLVRNMRRQTRDPRITLRQDDVATLAGYLQQSHDSVASRLGALMSATQTKRIAMAGVVASGVAVIGMVGTAAAAGDPTADPTTDPATTETTVTVDTTDGSSTTVDAPTTTVEEPTTTVEDTTTTAEATTTTDEAVVTTTTEAPQTTVSLVDVDLTTTTAPSTTVDVVGPPPPPPPVP
ncbi:MAG: hypothetical protein RLZ04_2649 [Actinomycetota bacterium]|jgi:hypothetical protein